MGAMSLREERPAGVERGGREKAAAAPPCQSPQRGDRAVVAAAVTAAPRPAVTAAASGAAAGMRRGDRRGGEQTAVPPVDGRGGCGGGERRPGWPRREGNAEGGCGSSRPSGGGSIGCATAGS